MATLWNMFDQHHLTENMRLTNATGKEEREFAEFLLRVGDGLEGALANDSMSADTLIKIPQKFWSNAKSTAEFCEEVYPNLTSVVSKGLESEGNDWHQWLIDRSIICPTNQDVDHINSLMIKKFPGELHTYKSHDKLLSDHQAHSFPVEYLNSVSVNGVPPHVLSLKVGAPIMLIRNLDPTRGHVNGTRYIIRALYQRLIYAEIAVGPYKGNCVQNVDTLSF